MWLIDSVFLTEAYGTEFRNNYFWIFKKLTKKWKLAMWHMFLHQFYRIFLIKNNK